MIEEIDSETLHRRFAEGERVRLLDIRTPGEVAQGVIPGSEHIPMHLIPPRINELKREQPIAVLCHHGGRSMQVAAFLVQQGFSHIANIAGGINAWSSQVDTSVPKY